MRQSCECFMFTFFHNFPLMFFPFLLKPFNWEKNNFTSCWARKKFLHVMRWIFIGVVHKWRLIFREERFLMVCDNFVTERGPIISFLHDVIYDRPHKSRKNTQLILHKRYMWYMMLMVFMHAKPLLLRLYTKLILKVVSSGGFMLCSRRFPHFAYWNIDFVTAITFCVMQDHKHFNC